MLIRFGRCPNCRCSGVNRQPGWAEVAVRGWTLGAYREGSRDPYRCSQEPHPGVEFYGQDGGCAECGYRPDNDCVKACTRCGRGPM